MIELRTLIGRIVATREENADQIIKAQQLARNANTLRNALDPVDFRVLEDIYNSLDKDEKVLLNELPLDGHSSYHFLSILLDTFYQTRINDIYAPVLDKELRKKDPYLLNKVLSAIDEEGTHYKSSYLMRINNIHDPELDKQLRKNDSQLLNKLLPALNEGWAYDNSSDEQPNLLDALKIDQVQAAALLSEYVRQGQFEQARTLVQMGVPADNLSAEVFNKNNSDSQVHQDEKHNEQQSSIPINDLSSKDDLINKFYEAVREGDGEYLRTCVVKPYFSRHWGNALRITIVEPIEIVKFIEIFEPLAIVEPLTIDQRLAILERQKSTQDFLLAQSAVKNKITALDLSRSDLNDSHIDLIAALITKLPNLTTLNLAGNQINVTIVKIRST